MAEQITTIKSGTKNYPVHKGDFLMDNGAILQFTASRTSPILYSKNWVDYRTVQVSKKTFKAYIEFYNLQPVVEAHGVTKYYF